MPNFIRLLISIVLCQAAGIIGVFFTTSSIPKWYAFLNKPSLTPPNWVFGPAWTTLYFLMGISLYLIWQTKSSKKISKKVKELGLILFFVQLGINTLWSIVFFGGQNIAGGLGLILILWILILFTIIYFQKINKLASFLLYPYLAWVSFATYLNFSIWLLNR